MKCVGHKQYEVKSNLPKPYYWDYASERIPEPFNWDYGEALHPSVTPYSELASEKLCWRRTFEFWLKWDGVSMKGCSPFEAYLRTVIEFPDWDADRLASGECEFDDLSLNEERHVA